MRWLIALCFIFTFLLSGCGSDTSASKENDFSPLTQIIITSENSRLADKTSNQFTAIGNFSNLFTTDITNKVTWESQDSEVLTIDENGLATAVSPGTVGISASMNGVIDFFFLTVTDATLRRIEVLPLEPTISKGLTEQFTATGTFSDASEQSLTNTVVWTAVDNDIVTIDQSGLATGVEEGTTNVTAAFDGVTKTTKVTVLDADLVSIDVSPDLAEVPQQLNVRYIATGTYTDGTQQTITTQVTWSSSNTSIATINSLGIAYGAAAGTSQITASLDSVSSTATLNVTADKLLEINISPSAPTVDVDSTVQLSATGVLDNLSQIDVTKNVTWVTNNNNATISEVAGSEGLATGVSAGSTTVTAKSGSVQSGSVTMTVN